jgi:hypothetical protein
MIKTVVVALIAAIILIALALAARAQTMNRDYPILPPVEYDYTYPGQLNVNVVPTTKEIRSHCNLPETSGALACSFRGKICTIYILPELELFRRGWDAKHVMRHEHGHCNGWSGDHKGARAAR